MHSVVVLDLNSNPSRAEAHVNLIRPTRQDKHDTQDNDCSDDDQLNAQRSNENKLSDR